MKKYIVILCIAMLAVSCSKDEELEKVNHNHIVVTGNLSDYITDKNLSKITHLTIAGTISGEDWNTLFEMATMGSLEILDMTEAKIKSKEDASCWNVDKIPEYEFCYSKTLKEVFLPKSLKVIGKEAFAECSKLTQIHFPEGLDSIAPRAFYKAGLLGELSIPPKLRVIGKQAFGRTKLNKVVINSDVIAAEDGTMYTIGGNSVFAYCEELTELIVKEGCTMLEVGFEGCSSLASISLPTTLRQIGYKSRSTHNYIFNRCKSLDKLDLPYNLWFIGYNAFANTSLTEIIIPENVQYLWTYAFTGCTQLEKVKLPKQLKQIAQGCFEGCTSLGEIVIPDKVTEVNYAAFADCTSLIKVQFGNNIKTIEDNAFSGCILLQSAVMPSSLKTLGKSAFEGCRNLVNVFLPDHLEEIESSTFKDCIELRDIYIGKSVLKVGSSSFFHCPKIELLNLPSSITQINSSAFAYTGIKELSVAWSIPLSIGNNIFEGVNLSKTRLVVPIGSKELYLQSSTWKDFGQIIEK